MKTAPVWLLTTALCLALAAPSPAPVAPPLATAAQLAAAARSQVGITTAYDPAYRKLAYPGGDVPLETGVCADVVIRAFRTAGLDLQLLVHEDMTAHFSAYPKKWGLKKPDANIDHRRVPNLMTYFTRAGKAQPLSGNAADYLPGDVVAWDLGNGLTHIGIVAATRSADGRRPAVVHNIGAGAREEDVLFAFRQIGHYRWFPPPRPMHIP